jgi:hypothetical protein
MLEEGLAGRSRYPHVTLDLGPIIQHIRGMPNISKKSLTADKRGFIDEFASLLAPWGMPQTAARLYGYLLLSAVPVSLDRIASDLEVSKSSACVAARLLEVHMLASRHGERGSKRVLYTASDNYAQLFSAQSSLLGSLAGLMRHRASTVASGAAFSRLNEMAEFYLSVCEAIETSIRELSTKATAAARRRA